MSESNGKLVRCLKCDVERHALQGGGWCNVCGYNPKHADESNKLRKAMTIALSVLETVAHGKGPVSLSLTETVALRVLAAGAITEIQKSLRKE
jgi:hypothetical protein